MRSFRPIVILSVALAACSKNDVDPNSHGTSGEIERSQYTADDGTLYTIEYRYDTWVKDYGLHLIREGESLTKEDDALAQNTIRDFFRKEICSPGFFPGLTSLIHFKDGRYGARLYCSTKEQKNVPQS